MTYGCYVSLPKRGIIAVTGADRTEFLQGLVSNDVTHCVKGRAVWAALLTPQGRCLHDFFVVAQGETLWLDCEGGDHLMDLGGRLRRHVLRSNVQLGIEHGMRHYALLNVKESGFGLSEEEGAALPLEKGVLFKDPRLKDMGLRLIAPEEEANELFARHNLRSAEKNVYDQTRIQLGLPDGSQDMEPGKALLLEHGFDELHGVDWQKGCYVGQEVTARMRYRGLVKKRLLPLRFTEEHKSLAHGISVMAGEQQVGVLRSFSGPHALALLRLERWRAAVEKGVPLKVGEIVAVVEVPDWVRLPKDMV